MNRRALLTAGGVLAGAASATGAVAFTDRRNVRRDPAADILRDPPEGRVLPVTGAGGVRLRCTVVGPDDAPTVVLIHGWTCCREFWAPQLNALGQELRLVSYDLRGHGGSEAPEDGDFSTDALADDLDAVLDACLRPGERAVVVGHSLGAMTTVAWAARHADRVAERAAGALLVSTGISDLMSESLVLRTPQRLSKPKAALTRGLLSLDVPLGTPNPLTHRVIRFMALSRSATPAQVAFCEQIVLNCNRRVRAGCARTLSRLDLSEAVASLTTPTTVLVGDADKLTPAVHARRLAKTLPQLEELVELPGKGHMLPVEAADEVSARIRTVVARHLLNDRRASLATAS